MKNDGDRKQARLLSAVTSFYLRSDRFNGLPVSLAMQRLHWPVEIVRDVAAVLLESGFLSVNAGDFHPNPHIKAFDPLPIDRQLASLKTADPHQTCLYPEPAHLKRVVDRQKYAGRPFTLRLALGEPQLKFAVFDLTVLEHYRSDPRYIYRHGDTQGSIYASDESRRKGLKRRDRVLLETFGFAYNARFNRAAASFLWYLSQLSPEHQALWQAKSLQGKYRLHPNYFRTQILGEWADSSSIFSAFLEEIRVINAMTKAMGRPPLFRNEPSHDDKPREFTFLIRPTSRELDAFRHLLDKLLADNINKAFFSGEVSAEEEIPRRDGRIEVRQKGTLRLLEEWLRARFRPSDPKPLDDMLKTLRSIRRERGKPAHELNDNVFDQRFFRQQRALIIEAYGALRMLRLILANFPAARSVEVPAWLYEGKICTY
jgi:hypothetical protein